MNLDPVEAWCRFLNHNTCSSLSTLDAIMSAAVALILVAAFVQAVIVVARHLDDARSPTGARQKKPPSTGPLRGLDVSGSLPEAERRRSPTDATRGRSPILLR
jgi:hypothetical protein